MRGAIFNPVGTKTQKMHTQHEKSIRDVLFSSGITQWLGIGEQLVVQTVHCMHIFVFRVWNCLKIHIIYVCFHSSVHYLVLTKTKNY